MPSNQTPLGALPSRFRKERLLIVGCGDIGVRLARLARSNTRLIALTSSPERLLELKSQGITAISGNLDDPKTLTRLSGLGTRVAHLAPPPSSGENGELDPRTQNLVRTLLKRTPALQCVYASTTGVYGDCSGAWVPETRPLNPTTARAKRRVHAEALMRFLGTVLAGSTGVTTLRVPGIYALDRDQGTPQARLQRGTPVLETSADVYTNHIQADDLARACWLALWRGPTLRAINTSDDTQMKMADYMDWAADHFGLKRPPRISAKNAAIELSPMQLSFMQESRRLVNKRIKEELRLKLNYPSIKEGLSK